MAWCHNRSSIEMVSNQLSRYKADVVPTESTIYQEEFSPSQYGATIQTYPLLGGIVVPSTRIISMDASVGLGDSLPRSRMEDAANKGWIGGVRRDHREE